MSLIESGTVLVGRLLTDTEWLMWVCRECHDYAHAHPAVSYEKGWLVSRHGETA